MIKSNLLKNYQPPQCEEISLSWRDAFLLDSSVNPIDEFIDDNDPIIF